MRNQCLNAPQAHPPAQNLADMGWVASRTHLAEVITSGVAGVVSQVGNSRAARMSSVREAMVKACGVTMAMVQGHSWVPVPSNGQQ